MYFKFSCLQKQLNVWLCLIILLSHNVYAQIVKTQIPDKMVVFTFDDAPASQYAIVAPLLKQYNFNATFFVCEFPPNYQDSSLYMNWRQIQALDKMGFEVANHTRTHAHVDNLSQAQFEEELNYIENKCDLLGIEKPVSFAYPAYALNSKSLAYLSNKGYTLARAGGSRVYDPLKDHPYLIPSWATNATNRKEILKALKKAKNGKIVVLTFHGVPDTEHAWVSTPPALFKEYLQFLSENDYTVLSMRDLEKYIDFNVAKEEIRPNLNKKYKNP